MTTVPLRAEPTTVTINDYLTAEELGKRLRLKATTIATWARQGKIPVHRLAPNVLRYRLYDVLTALEAAGSRARGGGL